MSRSQKLPFGLNHVVSSGLSAQRGLLSGGVRAGDHHGHGAGRLKALHPQTRMPVRQCQIAKKNVQAAGRVLRAADPSITIAAQIRHPSIQPYAKRWRGKNTLRGWLSEIDPRPLSSKRGRPRKKRATQKEVAPRIGKKLPAVV